MRLCNFCINRQILYVTFSNLEYCVIYLRVNHFYELTLPYQKIERLNKVEDRLIRDMMKAEVKLLCLRQQRRFI
jgi:hypothetical protein